MLRPFFIFLILLAFSARAFGADGTIPHPLVFKVIPVGQKSPISYLLASQHWGVGASDLPANVLGLFDEAEVHAFEIDFSKQFIALKKFLVSPTETNFFAVLPEAKSKSKNEMDQVQINRLISLGIPPWLAPVLPNKDCDLFEEFRYFSTHPNLQSLDSELTLRAKGENETVLALETEGDRSQADEHAADEGYSSNCRVTDYMNDNEKINAFDKQMDRLRTSYIILTPQDILRGPEIDDPSVNFRNRHWIEELAPLMNERSVFVTVGYDHFSGETGIIALLKAHGFNVSPLQ